jgi:hypothetical protein
MNLDPTTFVVFSVIGFVWVFITRPLGNIADELYRMNERNKRLDKERLYGRDAK